MKSWSFSLYICLHCDEVLIRWHFGTLDSANGPQDLPNMNKNHTLLHVDWYWWKETWEARWVHYDYWRAPRSHKYKYIYTVKLGYIKLSFYQYIVYIEVLTRPELNPIYFHVK